MPKYTRRELLRITSANVAVGVTTGTAMGQDDSVESNPDLRVRNQSSDPVDVSVRFFDAADGKRPTGSPIHTVQRSLKTGSSAVAEEPLSLSGGLYVVEVALDDGTTKETVWAVPPGGVTNWLTFSVRVRMTGDLSIGPNER